MQQPKFKSQTRLFAFHIALLPLGKVWIQLFSLQLWINSSAVWAFPPWYGNQSKRRKTEFKPVRLYLKIDLVSYPAWVEGLVHMDNKNPCRRQNQSHISNIKWPTGWCAIKQNLHSAVNYCIYSCIMLISET